MSQTSWPAALLRYGTGGEIRTLAVLFWRQFDTTYAHLHDIKARRDGFEPPTIDPESIALPITPSANAGQITPYFYIVYSVVNFQLTPATANFL